MSADLMSGMMSGASTGAMYSPDPVTGAIIGATVGGISGVMSGKRKKKAQRLRDQGMQRAMEMLSIDSDKERDLDRGATRGGMDWYKSNVLDTKEGKAAYAKLGEDKTFLDIERRLKKRADEGMGTREMQTRRNLEHSQTSQAMAQLGLQMGSSLKGYKGSTKEKIMASQNTNALRDLANREMQMHLANERVKREGLDDYQETYTARRMWDIRQAKDELGSMFTYGTSEAQRQSNDRALERQMKAQMTMEAALAEAEETAGGGFLGMF